MGGFLVNILGIIINILLLQVNSKLLLYNLKLEVPGVYCYPDAFLMWSYYYNHHTKFKKFRLISNLNQSTVKSFCQALSIFKKELYGFSGKPPAKIHVTLLLN